MTRLGACVLAAMIFATAFGACARRDETTSTTSRDSTVSGVGPGGTAAGSAVPMTAADSARSRGTGFWLAAKAYLDGWQASGASLARASGVVDTTRDADVASAFVLGKATEKHLFEAFEAAVAAAAADPSGGAARDTSIERKIRALHAARGNTLEHYQAFLADGTADELEIAKESYAEEVAIATPLGEELKAAMAKLAP